MFNYLMHFTCDCSDSSYIMLFNYINSIRKNELNQGYPAKSEWHTTYQIPKYLCTEGNPNNPQKYALVSKIESFCPTCQNVDPNRAIIMLTVKIPYDESQIDVFSYRYLIMIIRQLLRSQDFVAIECDSMHYNKIGSYFIIETLYSNQLVAYLTDENKARRLVSMPKLVTLSPEWFPAIYLNDRNYVVYEVLNNPLFENDQAIKNAISIGKSGMEKNKVDYRDARDDHAKDRKKYYQEYFKECFKIWINGKLNGFQIVNRLNSVSGMTQLLFASIYRNMYREKALIPTEENQKKLENLLEICCDFSDCILQTAENMISHSKGGVLSIRINENWGKIADTFAASATMDVAKSRYVRISLVDFSDEGILETIQKKTAINGLRLSHVFDAECQCADQVYLDYQDFLSKPDHVIHHYGLSVFSNVVKQYGGCFTVSSCAGGKLSPAQQYTTKASTKISYVGETGRLRIPGTEYDILMVLDEKLMGEEDFCCNPSLLITPDYITQSPTQRIIFTEEIFDFFNKPLSRMIARERRKYAYQALKEYVVKEASEVLAEKLIIAGDNAHSLSDCVFYFRLSNVVENIFGRVEIVAKILLQTVAFLKKKYNVNLHLYGVLYGLSENRIASFVRQYSLFYHRHEGNHLMQNCQLYVVSEDYQSEVLFAGPRLRAISDYCKSRRLVSGTSIGISNILEHVSFRETSDDEADYIEPIVPIPFDLMYRMEVYEGRVNLSSHRKWYYNNLITVLKNDIHGRDLGCCMKDVHIRTEKVHLHTFYEGQLLFSNTYWYHIFADYLYEMILKDDELNKKTKILLYGYETYSEQMLFVATRKLKEQGILAWYALYENPKYITVDATSETRIRYLNSFMEQCGEDDIGIVYIFGIGTTLATLSERMDFQLQNEFKRNGSIEKYSKALKKGYVIIQTRRSDEDNPIYPEIRCDAESHTVQSSKGYLNFLQDKQCRYLATVSTEWSSAESCKYCFPKNYLNELPLIQTNETSTIPLLLIKPSDSDDIGIRFLQEDTYTDSFLGDTRNSKYLYYSHLDRSGNHYQFYIRTANLFNDLLESRNEKLQTWFQKIKEAELTREEIHTRVNKINVIVSPLHFSNETFTAAVNKYVFDGKAYIINFDVKKEFRDSFVAKFRNYRSALEMMSHSKISTKVELNFYFVDDSIVTGATINRAKSLVTSMLGEFSFAERENVSVNLFKGIIVLLDRNSRSTACNFFERRLGCNPIDDENRKKQVILPFYRFIHLNTPSIRSYGDSCPICSQVEKIKRLEQESSLTFVEQHWRKKVKYHSLKKLSDAKKNKQEINKQHEGDALYQERGFRRLQCSEWIWAMLKREKINSNNAKEKLESEIGIWIGRQESSELKIEYLISFLKVISREHIVYQEGINTAALQILLAIFSLFVKDGVQEPVGIYADISHLIEESNIRRNNPQLIYDLYQMVVARLCAMGSMVFCREEQLEACLTTGITLESLCEEYYIHNMDRINGTEDFLIFLCIQMKKMLFVTKDSDFRIERLKEILYKKIKERDL